MTQRSLQASTLNAAKVKANQLARVSAITPQAETFTGRVQSLYPRAVTPEDNQQKR